ncbi:MAG: glycosyltransferase family 1 protein [Lachnospiraceae bacterium]|nr:glycosyltransferase family 1 protein [Lachnospiraceae bacterium]
MEKPIRILHVLGGTSLGGAESRIMDLYRHIDRNKVQFDFVVHTEAEGHFDKEINELGGRIFRVPRFRLYNYFSYRKVWKKFLKQHHEFKVIQGHMTSTAAIYLPLAKTAGIPITVAHARSAGVDRGIKGGITRWMRRNLYKKTDYMFTCSELAGISVFGEKAQREGKTIFIPNAIDCPAFAYDEGKREEMRRMLGLSDKYVIGHVGRFHYAKNHEYLLKVFAALKERGKKDYALILLGDGDKIEQFKLLAEKLGIAKDVHFLGNHNNVYDYYQAMDYFVYPSRFEGLPGTMVEAQTSGLRCIMSDTICREVVVTELVKIRSIEETPESWANDIEATADYERKTFVAEMQQAGFDVESQARKMLQFYKTGKWNL